MLKRTTLAIAFAGTLIASPLLAGERAYSPTVGKDYLQRVFWGDTHLHTSYSMDAAAMGNRDNGPADAFRFARGDTVRAQNGMLARLNRPLDFLVASDHADYLGLVNKLAKGDPRLQRIAIF